jgi:Rrf2 family nitric oxide-sensitive transcriptional repressor
MHLTTFSDYSMRVLMFLALQNRLVTIADIAARYQISENHLTKVVHFLGQRGYIETVRGKGGGLRLKSSADKINLGEVLRQTEPDSGLLPCTSGEGDCCIMPACRLIAILKESEMALFQVLTKYSLADLVSDKSPLSQILQPDL